MLMLMLMILIMLISYHTGAFDLFHVGHIEDLAVAKQLGDYLIVGVHDDRVVNKIKGIYHHILYIIHHISYIIHPASHITHDTSHMTHDT